MTTIATTPATDPIAAPAREVGRPSSGDRWVGMSGVGRSGYRVDDGDELFVRAPGPGGRDTIAPSRGFPFPTAAEIRERVGRPHDSHDEPCAGGVRRRVAETPTARREGR